MGVDGSCYGVKGFKAWVGYIIVPFCQFGISYCLVFCFKKISLSWCVKPKALCKSGYWAKRILVLCFCEGCHLSADLNKRYRLLVNSCFLLSLFSNLRGSYCFFSHLALSMALFSSLLASYLCAMHISCEASQTSFCMWKRSITCFTLGKTMPGNKIYRCGHIQGNFLNCLTQSFWNVL